MLKLILPACLQIEGEILPYQEPTSRSRMKPSNWTLYMHYFSICGTKEASRCVFFQFLYPHVTLPSIRPPSGGTKGIDEPESTFLKCHIHVLVGAWYLALRKVGVACLNTRLGWRHVAMEGGRVFGFNKGKVPCRASLLAAIMCK
jgi:hypothetical protein